MHLWFEMLANELNDAGLPMQKVLKPTIDIDWTPISIKEYLWRPVQEAMLKKHSTTELTKNEVTKVFEILNRHLGEKFGIHVPWPHDPEKDHPFIDALEMAKTVEYPDDYQEPTI
jgi:hypothetical protein